MREFEERVLKIAVLPKGEPIFHEECTTIEIMDCGGGEYLKAQQTDEKAEMGAVFIDDANWPTLRAAIDRMHALTRI